MTERWDQSAAHTHTTRPVYVPKRQRLNDKEKRQRKNSGKAVVRFQKKAAHDEINRRVGAYFPSDDHFVALAEEENEVAFQSLNDDGNDIPISSKNRRSLPQQQQQSIADFMDEQDHNDWGGPTNVRREYSNNEQHGTAATSNERLSRDNNTVYAHEDGDDTVDDWSRRLASKAMMHQGNEKDTANHAALQYNDSIGRRLLKQLGWRPDRVTSGRTVDADRPGAGKAPTFTAYVPASSTDNVPRTSDQNVDIDDDDDDIESAVYLSSKKLRKIVQIQTELSSIIPQTAWKRSFGLGYVGQLPSLLSSSSTTAALKGPSKNVYQTSNLLLTNHEQGYGGASSDEPPNTSNTSIVAFGAKSTAGFALDDEDDDVYDNASAQQPYGGRRGGGADERSSHTVLGWNTLHSSSAARSSVTAKADANQQLVVYNGDADNNSNRSSSKPPHGSSNGGSNNESHSLVAYEHVDSDAESVDGPTATLARRDDGINDLKGVLSAWAKAPSTNTADIARFKSDEVPLRKDDNPRIIVGFVRESVPRQRQQQLILESCFYRGLDVPLTWNDESIRHVFGPTEHPSIFQALARANQLQEADARRDELYAQALHAATVKPSMISTSGTSFQNSSSDIVTADATDRVHVRLPTSSGPAIVAPSLLPAAWLPPRVLNEPAPPSRPVLLNLPPTPLPPPPSTGQLPPKLLYLPRPPTNALLPLPLQPVPFVLPQPPMSVNHQAKNSVLATPVTTTTGGNASVFSGVRAAIQNRFTAAKSNAMDGGPRAAADEESKPGDRESSPSRSDNFRITRTVTTFLPEPLLCKRFNVKSTFSHPSLIGANADSSLALRTREEAYFYDEIMAEAKLVSAKTTVPDSSPPVEPSQTPTDEKRGLSSMSALADLNLSVESVDTVMRPSMALFKSIFDPDSHEKAPNESDDDSLKASSSETQNGSALGPTNKTNVDSGDLNGHVVTTALVQYESDGNAVKGAELDDDHRRYGKLKYRKRRSSSTSSSDEYDNERIRRRRKEDRRDRASSSKRRKKDKKHRKEKHKRAK